MIAIDLANNALALLKEPPMDGFDPNGHLAQRMCYMHYHPTRREVLCAHRWPFAMKTAVLKPNEPTTAERYSVAHTLPTDAIRVLDVGAAGWNLRGRTIFAAVDDLQITYTRDEEDLDLWSQAALYAFEHLLAAKMCIPLINSPTLRQELMSKYENKLKSIQNQK